MRSGIAVVGFIAALQVPNELLRRSQTHLLGDARKVELLRSRLEKVLVVVNLSAGNRDRVHRKKPRTCLPRSIFPLQSATENRLAGFCSNRVRPARLCIHFQGYRLVAATIQKSTHVKLENRRMPKLLILFHVDEFVKQHAFKNRFVRCEFPRHRDLGNLRPRRIAR